MLVNEVINHMDADELRNYISHCKDVIGVNERLTMAQTGLLRTYRQIVDDIEFADDALRARNNVYNDLSRLERELEEKYQEFMPVIEANSCSPF